jgi:hypothetical protein
LVTYDLDRRVLANKYLAAGGDMQATMRTAIHDRVFVHCHRAASAAKFAYKQLVPVSP